MFSRKLLPVVTAGLLAVGSAIAEDSAKVAARVDNRPVNFWWPERLDLSPLR